MKCTILRKDREGWSFGITECGDLFVGWENDYSEQTTYWKDTPDNRKIAEDYWKTTTFAKEVKEVSPKVKASMKYDKANVKQVKLSLNKKTDADILRILESKENVQGYIKELIRRDNS